MRIAWATGPAVAAALAACVDLRRRAGDPALGHVADTGVARARNAGLRMPDDRLFIRMDCAGVCTAHGSHCCVEAHPMALVDSGDRVCLGPLRVECLPHPRDPLHSSCRGQSDLLFVAGHDRWDWGDSAAVSASTPPNRRARLGLRGCRDLDGRRRHGALPRGYCARAAERRVVGALLYLQAEMEGGRGARARSRLRAIDGPVLRYA